MLHSSGAFSSKLRLILYLWMLLAYWATAQVITYLSIMPSTWDNRNCRKANGCSVKDHLGSNNKQKVWVRKFCLGTICHGHESELNPRTPNVPFAPKTRSSKTNLHDNWPMIRGWDGISMIDVRMQVRAVSLLLLVQRLSRWWWGSWIRTRTLETTGRLSDISPHSTAPASRLWCIWALRRPTSNQYLFYTV